MRFQVSTIGAARIPLTLLAAIYIPMPLPQTRMPRSNSPAATPLATALRVVRIVNRDRGGRAEVLMLDAEVVEDALQCFLQLKPA